MLASLVNLAQVPPGRVRYALTQLPPAATAHPDVAARVADLEAAAADRVEVAKAYARSRGKPRARGRAVAIDNQIDRLIGGIHMIAQANVATLDPGAPTHVASAALLAKVFPLGAAAITSLPFEEELDAVKELLADLDAEPGLAAQAKVAEQVEALRPLVVDFAAELAKQAEIVEHRQVKAAQARMQRALAVLVCQIIAAWPQPEDEDALRAALAPLLDQIERVRAQRRRNRTVTEVDPQTGVEIDPSVDPEVDPEDDGEA